MAFPQVVAYNTSATAGTSHVVSLPAGIEIDDLLIVFFATDGDISFSNLGGFTQLFSMNNGTACSLSIFYKIAVGSDTLTLVTNQSEGSSHVSVRITGHNTTQMPEVSTGATGINTKIPDPDSLTPTGGAKDYLWFAVEGNDDNDTTTAYPLPGNNLTKVGADSNVGVCSDELNQSSLDPGTFTISANEQWVACTVAVHPIAAPSTYDVIKTDNLVDIYAEISKKQIGAKQDNVFPIDSFLKLSSSILSDVLISLNGQLEHITIRIKMLSDQLLGQSDTNYKKNDNILADSVHVLYDNSYKLLLKELIDSVNILIDDYEVKREALKVLLEDTFFIADITSKLISVNKIEIIGDTTDVVLKTLNNIISDKINLIDIIITKLRHILVDDVNISDVFNKYLINIKSMLDDTILFDTQIKRLIKLTLDDVILSDTQTKKLIKSISDKTELYDTQTKKIIKSILDDAILSDINIIIKRMTQIDNLLSINGLLLKYQSQLIGDNIINLSDDCITTVIGVVRRLLQDSILLFDLLNKKEEKSSVEILSIMFEKIIKKEDKINTDILSQFIDIGTKRISELTREEVSFYDIYKKQLLKTAYSDAINLFDKRYFLNIKTMGDILVSLEKIFTKALYKIQIEDFMVFDNYEINKFSDTVIKLLQDSILLDDIFKKGLTKTQSESLGIYDNHTEEIIKVIITLLYWSSNIKNYFGKESNIKSH